MLGSNSKLEGLCSAYVTKVQSFSQVSDHFGFSRPSCNLIGLGEITKIDSHFHFLAVLKKGQTPLNSKYYSKHWCNRALNGKGFSAPKWKAAASNTQSLVDDSKRWHFHAVCPSCHPNAQCMPATSKCSFGREWCGPNRLRSKSRSLYCTSTPVPQRCNQ